MILQNHDRQGKQFKMDQSAGILARKGGGTIAYRRASGKIPGILFIHGLRSDMNGSKAKAIEAYCRAEGRAFLCFDLSGHGLSSGRFEQGTIGGWAEDVVAVLDELTDGPQILVGSSLGGWLMLLTALARPERVAGLLGLAAAPDFTEDLTDNFDASQRDLLNRQGEVPIADCYGGAPYLITRTLIDEGRRHLLLRGPIALTCPVTLIQGQADTDVPWRTALTLADRLASERVTVILRKSAGHRLSEADDLQAILMALGQLITV
jgi:pimeloyl-ACP methyl ester carboxylesterase